MLEIHNYQAEDFLETGIIFCTYEGGVTYEGTEERLLKD